MEYFEIISRVGTDSPVTGRDLARFFDGLHTAHKEAYRFVAEEDPYLSRRSDQLLPRFKRYLADREAPPDWRAPPSGLDVKRPPEDIYFTAITTNSPLKFVGYCSGISMVALALTVSLAGGEVDMQHGPYRATFKVNSLGDAAARLHGALNSPEVGPAARNPLAGPRK